jgi:hypothetical protein
MNAAASAPAARTIAAAAMVAGSVAVTPNNCLTRLQGLLTRHATRALPEIWDLIMSEVRQYGLQRDDQSLLLLRVLDAASANPLVM